MKPLNKYIGEKLIINKDYQSYQPNSKFEDILNLIDKLKERKLYRSFNPDKNGVQISWPYNYSIKHRVADVFEDMKECFCYEYITISRVHTQKDANDFVNVFNECMDMIDVWHPAEDGASLVLDHNDGWGGEPERKYIILDDKKDTAVMFVKGKQNMYISYILVGYRK